MLTPLEQQMRRALGLELIAAARKATAERPAPHPHDSLATPPRPSAPSSRRRHD